MKGSASKPVRVGVLDNDCCALEYIVGFLHRMNNRNGRKLTIWSSDNPAQTIQECRFGTNRTDVVVLDLALNGLTGAQVATELRHHVPNIGIIGITSYRPETYLPSMRRAGAQALLDKSTLKRTLVDAIDTVALGLPYPDDTAFAPIVRTATVDPQPTEAQTSANLTKAERQILALSLSSLTTSDIANTLHISSDTVFSHRRNIKNKFGLNSWNDVVNFCRTMHIA